MQFDSFVYILEFTIRYPVNPKSTSMKNNAEPSFYFSAYPLKALGKNASAEAPSGHSPFLRAILSGKTRTVSRVRVLPMVNPYRETQKTTIRETGKMTDGMEKTEKEWFNNYE